MKKNIKKRNQLVIDTRDELEIEMMERFGKYCIENCLNKSALIRKLIKDYLNKQ